MGLVSAGWQALSEDQCVIDLAPDGIIESGRARAGCAETRRSAVPSLVADRAPRFEAVDKVAWDLSKWVAHSPAELNRIVLLEPPDGSELVWESLTEAEVIGGLTTHTTWLQRQDAFAPTVLPPLVKLGMTFPASECASTPTRLAGARGRSAPER